MDVPGMENIKLITRSDSGPPCVQKVAIGGVNGTYETGFQQVTGKSLETLGRSLSDDQLRSLSDVLIKRTEERISRLLCLYDYKAIEKEDALALIRNNHKLPDHYLALFKSLATEKNDLLIDTFLANKPELVADVARFFSQNVGINLNQFYNEEWFAAVIYALFGSNIVDYDWELGKFMLSRVLSIINGNTSSSEHLAAFDQRITPLIEHELSDNPQDFYNRLQYLEENREITNDIVIDLTPKAYLLQIIDKNGSLSEYVELPKALDRETFEVFLKSFDTGIQYTQVYIPEIVDTNQLLGVNQGAYLFGDRLWLKLPVEKIGARKIREIFKLFHAIRTNKWGKPFIPKPNRIDELFKIALIEHCGLFGVNQRTAKEIIEDPTLLNGSMDENGLAQMKRRRLNDLRIDKEQFRLFNN